MGTDYMTEFYYGWLLTQEELDILADQIVDQTEYGKQKHAELQKQKLDDKFDFFDFFDQEKIKHYFQFTCTGDGEEEEIGYQYLIGLELASLEYFEPPKIFKLADFNKLDVNFHEISLVHPVLTLIIDTLVKKGPPKFILGASRR